MGVKRVDRIKNKYISGTGDKYLEIKPGRPD